MREFLIRSASGVVFVALFLTALLWHPLAFCIIFSAAVAIMMGEYLHISLRGTEMPAKIMAVLSGTGLFVLLFLIMGYGADWKWILLIPLCVTLILTAVLFTPSKESYRSTPFLLSSILYIALPFSMTNFIAFNNEGGFDGSVILSIMILIWTSDVGAYLFGSTLGKRFGHKLFPSVSPKKSWEGYFGGLLCTVAAGWILYRFNMTGITLLGTLLLSVIVNVTSTIGDLAESQFKRSFGVKDSGKIMPGHGGLLDRFDGALLAFPAAVTYLILIHPSCFGF